MSIPSAAETITEALDLAQKIGQYKGVDFRGVYPNQYDKDSVLSLSISFDAYDVSVGIKPQGGSAWCAFPSVFGAIEEKLEKVPGAKTYWKSSTAIECFEWIHRDLLFAQNVEP